MEYLIGRNRDSVQKIRALIGIDDVEHQDERLEQRGAGHSVARRIRDQISQPGARVVFDQLIQKHFYDR